jgi:hypothetical protein
MKKIFLNSLFIFATLIVAAQEVELNSNTIPINLEEPLVVSGGALGGITIMDGNSGNKLTKYDVRFRLKNSPEALKIFNSGILCKNGSNAFAAIGGFFVGYALGAMLATKVLGHDIPLLDYYMLGAGVVLMSPAFVLDKIGNDKIKKSIGIYNSEQALRSSHFEKTTKIMFVLTQNGVGISVVF